MLKKLLIFSSIINTSTQLLQSSEVNFAKAEKKDNNALSGIIDNSKPMKLIASLNVAIARGYKKEDIIAYIKEQNINIDIQNGSDCPFLNANTTALDIAQENNLKILETILTACKKFEKRETVTVIDLY